MSEQPTASAPEASVAEASVPEASVEQYNAWLAGVKLGAIEVVRLHAERRLGGIAPQTAYEMGVGWANEGDKIFWRYDVTAHLTDDAGADFGDVQVSVVLTAAHEQSDVDAACVERFGSTSGVFMTHPYLREAVATTALRLGFPGVTLPMMTTA